MSSDAASAFFSLTQAEYAAGNFKNKVAEGPMSARIRVGAGVDNVAGVKIPVFTLYETGATADNQSLGLVGGGKKIQNVRDKFTNFIEMLIKLASLQTSFVTLDEALKVTNRRVNALENVTIPKIQAVLDYISRELDELEREGEFLVSFFFLNDWFGCIEDNFYGVVLLCLLLINTLRIDPLSIHLDFTRLKLVQGKKESEIEEELKRKEAEKTMALKSGKSVGKENSADITAQFDAQDDEDVVF